ncbi:hypothetical protein A3Q56_05150 [Intoshia linei]|uniref:Uncharacterized protein n=1 Tax=Intoshia linei TaxID=1819745 RepID=A0A177B107_9BILA|nr:hypothetical protein A3Q56_05150 [Intoshia linei]
MLTDFGDFDESHRQEKMLLEIGNLTCDEDILNYIAANKLTLQDLYYISKCNEYKIKCKKQEISCKRYRVEFLNKQRLDKHKTKRPSHLIINKSIQNPNNSDYSSEKFVKLEAKLIEQIEINDKLGNDQMGCVLVSKYLPSVHVQGELKISQNTYAEKNKELTRIENKIKQLEMEANLTDNHSENIIQSQNNIMQLLVVMLIIWASLFSILFFIGVMYVSTRTSLIVKAFLFTISRHAVGVMEKSFDNMANFK